jgi:hypothetical protein
MGGRTQTNGDTSCGHNAISPEWVSERSIFGRRVAALPQISLASNRLFLSVAARTYFVIVHAHKIVRARVLGVLADHGGDISGVLALSRTRRESPHRCARVNVRRVRWLAEALFLATLATRL